VDLILNFIYVIDQLVPCISLCVVHVYDYSICWSLHFAVCCRNWWWV